MNIFKKLINILIVLVIAILPILVFVQPVSAVTPWYNSAWLYRKAFTVTGSVAGAQTNYQIKLTINFVAGTDSGTTLYMDSKCQTDFDDIRFTNSTGTVPLYAYLESKTDSSSAVVWVKLDSVPVSPSTATFYIYYGNATVASGWDINNTFIFGDDFNRANSATVGNGWTEGEANGTWEISGNTLLYTVTVAGGTATCSHTLTGLTTNNRLILSKKSSAASPGLELLWGTQTATQGGGWGWWSTGTRSVDRLTAGWIDTTYDFVDNVYNLYRINYYSGTGLVDFIIDGAYSALGVAPWNGGITNIINISKGGGVGTVAVTSTFDYIYVTNYCSPEPTITAWATVEVQATPVVIQDVKVFQSYKATNDWLIAIRYLDIYAPYYDTYDIKQYFVFQLTNAAGTVLAQTTLPRWGNSVGNIYLSPTLAGSLTYGGIYYIKIYGLFSGNPVVTYTLVGTDWQGNDLTRLDSWVISSASVLNTYYTPTAFTTYVAGRGELLNAAGGSIFDTGINGLSTVRPNIFQTYTSTTTVPANVYTQPYRIGLSAWQTNIGTDGTVMLTRLGNLVGVPGNMIAMFLFVVMMVVLAVIAFPAGATLAANILSIPLIFAGIFFGFDLIYILLLALFAAFLLAKKLFMDTGA